MDNKFYEVDMAYVKSQSNDFGSAHIIFGTEEDKVVLSVSLDEDIDKKDLKMLLKNLGNRKDVQKLKLNIEEDLLIHLCVKGEQKDVKNYLG